MKIELNADSVQVYGPKQSDGSYNIKFTTGEYEAVNVAKLLAIPHDSVLKVTVEVDNG